MDIFQRARALYSEEQFKRINNAKVIVFGVGGVGGYVIEALVRNGISNITIVDFDKVEESNINRQIIATTKTIGRKKVDVMKERILDINPDAIVTAIDKFYLPENSNEFDLKKYDYVIDAIDTMSAKKELIRNAKLVGSPIISALGAGNKIDPTKLEVTDIYKTSVDPLAKILRHELKEMGIKDLKVVYSKETPIKVNEEFDKKRRASVGSTSFVPSSMGLIIASEVIKDLIK